MSDNKRWFKVWTTLLIDKINDDLTFEEIGMFTLLGCLIAQKGDNGNLVVSRKLFKTFFDAEILPEKFCQKFNVKIGSNDNTNISVSLKNWHKFQLDSTGYERLKKWRNKKNETVNDNGDKIRKDKIRKDKIKEDKKEEDIPSFFLQLKENPAYKGIDLERELGKMDAWLLLPQNKGRKKTHKFILNWLNKIDIGIISQPVKQESQYKTGHGERIRELGEAAKHG